MLYGTAVLIVSFWIIIGLTTISYYITNDKQFFKRNKKAIMISFIVCILFWFIFATSTYVYGAHHAARLEKYIFNLE